MHSDKDLGRNLKLTDAVLSKSTVTTLKMPEKTSHFHFRVLGWYLLSFVPWTMKAKTNVLTPIVINKELGNSDTDPGTSFRPTTAVSSEGSTAMGKANQKIHFDIKLSRWSLLSLLPWAFNGNDSTGIPPTTINKGLKRRARSRVENGFTSVESLRFRPYVSKVPWHTGPRGFLSLLFPRYGHYCGPNWSSGKDGGSALWDKRPIDWLDYCCYCHDIGYDTHDQANLLKADLEFLECLERPRPTSKGETSRAHLYKTMCMSGLRNFLIPYRTQLVNLQLGLPILNFGWLSRKH